MSVAASVLELPGIVKRSPGVVANAGIFALADRIVVLYGGKLRADLPASDADRAQIGLLVAGGEAIRQGLGFRG